MEVLQDFLHGSGPEGVGLPRPASGHSLTVLGRGHSFPSRPTAGQTNWDGLIFPPLAGYLTLAQKVQHGPPRALEQDLVFQDPRDQPGEYQEWLPKTTGSLPPPYKGCYRATVGDTSPLGQSTTTP